MFFKSNFLGVKKEELKDTKLNTDWESKETTNDTGDKYLSRRLNNKIDIKIAKQLKKGSVLALITSRPGQSGRVDGYILEGAELDFYQKK
jgi:small subunit ribosomal protein S8e